MPCTEILGSSFSLYKQLERQHSKGGFTSVLPTFAALLKPTTPAAVSKAFAQVSNNDVKQWASFRTLISPKAIWRTARATVRAGAKPAAHARRSPFGMQLRG